MTISKLRRDPLGWSFIARFSGMRLAERWTLHPPDRRGPHDRAPIRSEHRDGSISLSTGEVRLAPPRAPSWRAVVVDRLPPAELEAVRACVAR